ncbi:hypothetical protein A0H81_13306 [Grifola frondosa]|uniref:Uncharacterized protein n=1 Tax=Grifola frondosa TaxID=5627 RepID=A0A1C7LS23_GRIFR|nr:hypothetical protein A0H81_13306 [Grifola frondosa]
MERFRLWKDLRRKQTQSLGVVQSAMGKQVLIMYCTSLLDDPHFSTIPSCDIPEEKIHIVLLDTSRISEKTIWTTRSNTTESWTSWRSENAWLMVRRL